MQNKTVITDNDLGNTCLPEDYFFIPEIAPPEINEGVLSTLVDRAYAIVLLLGSDGESGDSFQWNHKIIMNMLYAVDGLLKQAKQVLRHPYHPEFKREDKS